MEKLLLLTCFLCTISFVFAQNNEIEGKLKHVYKKDQKYRVKLLDFFKNNQIDSIVHYTELMKIADVETYRYTV